MAMTTDINVAERNNATEFENKPFSSHILPAAIITVVFLALILIIITALKLCNCIRRRAMLTSGLSRVFNESDSEQDLQARSNNKELHVCTTKKWFADGTSSENMQTDPEDDISVQEFQEEEDVEEFIGCARNALGKQSLKSLSSNGLGDEREMGARSDDCIVYNPDHDGVHMTVEVEMHPKELQCYSESLDNSSQLAIYSV